MFTFPGSTNTGNSSLWGGRTVWPGKGSCATGRDPGVAPCREGWGHRTGENGREEAVNEGYRHKEEISEMSDSREEGSGTQSPQNAHKECQGMKNSPNQTHMAVKLLLCSSAFNQVILSYPLQNVMQPVNKICPGLHSLLLLERHLEPTETWAIWGWRQTEIIRKPSFNALKF